MKSYKVLLIIFLVLAIDQFTKIYVKTHFELYENMELLPWFRIVFIENEGMAWGTRLSDLLPFMSPEIAKPALTFFRIAAVTGIGLWLYTSIGKERSKTLIVALAVIFAGALGNILDSVFYGVIFNDSLGAVAQIFPENGGYSKLFYGNVVDMLHFPIWSGRLSENIPLIGGNYFSFFDPVFNVADVAITSGIAVLLVFNRKVFNS